MYGIIDIGSNTIRLVLYDIRDGKIQPMLNKKFTAGLAGYVKKGRMTDEGVEVLIEILNEFAAILEYVQVDELFCLATAAIRNSANADDIAQKVKERTGFDLIILSGEEEARYDYYGAMQSVKEASGLVVDIGGGSTELVFYSDDAVSRMYSIPLGSLTAYQDWVSNILPTAEEAEMIALSMKEALSAVSAEPKSVICGVGGSIRAAGKVCRELGKPLENEHIRMEDLASLLEVPQKTLAGAILKTAPERIHTFLPGLILLCTIAEKWEVKELVVSTSGVKEGFLLAHLMQEGVL